MRKIKTLKSVEKLSTNQWNALAEKDRRKHTSHYKGVPTMHFAKFIEVGGVPHKMVDGVLVPLQLKQTRQISK